MNWLKKLLGFKDGGYTKEIYISDIIYKNKVVGTIEHNIKEGYTLLKANDGEIIFSSINGCESGLDGTSLLLEYETNKREKLLKKLRYGIKGVDTHGYAKDFQLNETAIEKTNYWGKPLALA